MPIKLTAIEEFAKLLNSRNHATDVTGGDLLHYGERRDNNGECSGGTIVRFVSDKGDSIYECLACQRQWDGGKLGVPMNTDSATAIGAR